jgi:hypothetical protein
MMMDKFTRTISEHQTVEMHRKHTSTNYAQQYYPLVLMLLAIFLLNNSDNMVLFNKDMHGSSL